jgi:hypothetical protein
VQIDPLVSLMMVEKVPDSTYEMIGGLDKQIMEIKEVIELPVKHPELFEALGIAQPKVGNRPHWVCLMLKMHRACYSTGHPAQAKHCWPAPSHTTPNVHLSACPARSWYKSSLAKAREWCANCS